MKKALPILFVASTVVVTAASLTVATNGGFTQLRAADNSHTYTITFTKSDVDSSQTESTFEGKKFYFSKQTTSGFEFGCQGKALVDGDMVYVAKQDSSNMVDVELWDEKDDSYDDASFDMTFHFQNVLSAVSVVLNGVFSYPGGWGDKTSFEFLGSEANNGEATINASASGMKEFSISSIVVQYTCSY